MKPKPKLDVTFVDGVLDEDDRDRVQYALMRIDHDGGTGGWPHPVRHVNVLKAFHQGRSGGLVLRVELAFEGHALTRVVKVDRVDVVERDWQGYQRVSSVASSAFAPVVAASCDVVDPRRRSRQYCWGAVVYGDAAEFDGDSSSATWTLEEVAADPSRVDEAVDVVKQLFKRTESAFYKAKHIDQDSSSLRRLNRRLGPALVVRSDSGPDVPRLPAEILRRTTTGMAGDIEPGDRISFELSERDPVKIVVDGKLALAGTGEVVESRGLKHWKRLPRPALPSADPFAALLPVLEESLAGRVTCPSHGDLNARNVLVIGGRPYLIDYAESDQDMPQQLDFSWLEVSLLRDVYANRDAAGLIRLQRALAVGSRLLHLGVDADEVLGVCRGLVHESNHDALRVLLAIRVQAHRLYPAEARPEWWRDHLAQMLLSAHRTLKWPHEKQSRGKFNAIRAVAAVATEWLLDGDPFEHWDQCAGLAKAALTRHLRRTLRAASPQLAAELRTEHYMELAANDAASAQQLIEQHGRVALSGERGSGKTTVLREFGRRLLDRPNAPVPLFVPARDFTPEMIDPEHGRLGVVHLIIDDASPELLTALAEKYPDLRVLASVARGTVAPGYQDVELRDLDEHAIEKCLWRRVPHTYVDKLMGMLTDSSVRRLDIRRPRALSLLVDHVAEHGIPSSSMDLYRAMLLAKVDGDEEALLAGEAVAMRLLDGLDPGPVDPRLTQAGMIVDDGGGPRFVDNADRDHLAALGLRHLRLTPEGLSRRTVTREWQNTLAVFVALPEVCADEVAALVEAVASPVGKARLLAAAANCPRATLEQFIADQQEILRGDDLRARFASTMLRMLNVPSALSQVVVDATASDTARTAALEALVRLPWQARPGDPHRAATKELIKAIRVVLTGETSAALRQVACAVTATADLKQLALLVADQVSTTGPWELTAAAAEALRKLGVIPTSTVLDAYREACRRRLADSDRLLRGVKTCREAFAIRAAELALLDQLTPEDRRAWFPKLRFGFCVRPKMLGDAPPIPGDSDRWLDLVEHGSPEEAALAAHHLLAAAPVRAPEILDRIGPTPGRDRLLIAAAAVGPHTLTQAEELLLRVLPDIGPADLEGLAGLLVAIFRQDRDCGIRLAVRANTRLTARELPDLQYWPWSVAVGMCGVEPEVQEALINAGDVDLAIDALSSHNFLYLGERGPDHVLGAEARDRLLAARTEANLVDWAHAAATARLTEAAPVIREFVEGGRRESVLVRALGYLTMLRAEADPTDPEVARCLPLLSTWDGQVYRQEMP